MLIFAFLLRAKCFFFFFFVVVDFFVFTLLIYLTSEPNRSPAVAAAVTDAVAVAVAATMANCKLSQTHVENWNSKSKAAREQKSSTYFQDCVCACQSQGKTEGGRGILKEPTAWKCEQLHEYWATIQYKHTYTDISICICVCKYHVCMFTLS